MRTALRLRRGKVPCPPKRPCRRFRRLAPASPDPTHHPEGICASATTCNIGQATALRRRSHDLMHTAGSDASPRRICASATTCNSGGATTIRRRSHGMLHAIGADASPKGICASATTYSNSGTCNGGGFTAPLGAMVKCRSATIGQRGKYWP